MKVFISLMLFLAPLLLAAQELEMADQMRSEGKIYVVVAVLLAILLGLLLFLFRIDRKVKKLEKEVQK